MDGNTSASKRTWVEAQNLAHAASTPAAVLETALNHFGARFALVSSFGAESAVLLHIAAEIDKNLPILFLDTGKLFGETKRYRDKLLDQLGMTNLIIARPAEADVSALDPKGDLWVGHANQCCYIRKVKPLHTQLVGFDAWATGRKRFQSSSREALDHFELQDDHIKVNPLALWTSEQVKAYRSEYDLPQHPLVADGFRSIGCMPCTDRVADGEDERAGRWRGSAKTECGIHLGLQENATLASFEGSEL